jgi:hypothetical protein
MPYYSGAQFADAQELPVVQHPVQQSYQIPVAQ